MIKRIHKKYAHYFLLAVAVGFVISTFWAHKDKLLRPYDYDYFGSLYSDSQYVKGQLSKGGIGDDGLYAFAGYYYITGGDVSQVNFENPPLGNYLIGVSAILFKNEIAINIIYAAIFFITVYKIAYILLKNRILASLVVLLLSIDPLIQMQLTLSMLDLPMVSFFLVGCLFWLYGLQAPKGGKWLFLSALFFSLSFVIKFFPFLPFLVGTLMIGTWKENKIKFKQFALYFAVLLPLVYILSYSMYFVYHPSMIDFLKYQVWVVNWRSSNPFVFGNMVTTMLVGWYRSWWGNPQWLYSTDWSIVMSLTFISGVLGLGLWWKTGYAKWLALMTGLFVLYVSVGTVGVAKYMLPVYPLLTIAGIQFISGLLMKYPRYRTIISSEKGQHGRS